MDWIGMESKVGEDNERIYKIIYMQKGANVFDVRRRV